MSQTDWAKIYAKMDKRIVVKYDQLPKGEQIGKRPPAEKQPAKVPNGISSRDDKGELI